MGPIEGILFELSTDDILDIVALAGMPVESALTENENAYDKNRKRAYRPRIQGAYNKLPPAQQRRAVLNLAKELSNRGRAGHLDDALRKIGWHYVGDELVPIQALDPADLDNVPEKPTPILVKAASRLRDDPTGAISAACGAVDSVTVQIYQKYKLGNSVKLPFKSE